MPSNPTLSLENNEKCRAEPEVKIAYIVSAYRYPGQLERLIRRLHSQGNWFLIHVDKRTDNETFLEMVGSLRDLPRVHFLDRHKCYWGDFGHVRASIKAISEIFRRKIPFDYAILLTGQDYPIKTNNEIAEFLKNSEGRSYLHSIELPNEHWRTIDRLEAWHFRLSGRQITLPMRYGGMRSALSLTNSPLWVAVGWFLPKERKLPLGFGPYGGGSYWCLSRACVEYMHDFINSHPSFVRYFKYVFVPDEHFFQTLLLNSPLKDDIVNDDLRYVVWSKGQRHPAILTTNDFSKLAGSHKLFARKFDAAIDAEILDLIDKEILGQTIQASALKQVASSDVPTTVYETIGNGLPK